MTEEKANAQLVTSGCTSGWADPVWGELWLLPEGLLRLSLGWKGLVAAATLGAIGTAPSGSLRRIEPEEIPDLLAKSRRNRWVPRDQIDHAAIWRGLMNVRLNVWLSDGTRIKLLWLRGDPASGVLRQVLDQWLGDRLRAK
jgi:hypothetical protein